MNVLLTGADGQLGIEISAAARKAGHVVTETDVGQLDITQAREVETAIERYRPDVVINAAAWTAVDAAEQHKADAIRVNVDGPANLARVCAANNIPIVHFSTDYVFDGSGDGAYTEDDETGPLNAYGMSKLRSEEQVRDNNDQHLIFRTSWLFSSHGSNFVKTMLQLGRERNRLSIVSDQVGKPTSAQELARIAIAALDSGKPAWGTYHVAQPEAVSWYGFAQQIFAIAGELGLPLQITDVEAVTADAFRTAAERPANSELDSAKVEATFGLTIRSWRESLPKVIKELQQNGFFT